MKAGRGHLEAGPTGVSWVGLPSKETLRWRLASSKLIGTCAQLSTCQGVKEVTAEGNGELPQSYRDLGLTLDRGGPLQLSHFRQRRRGRPLCPHVSQPLDAGCSRGGVGSLGGKKASSKGTSRGDPAMVPQPTTLLAAQG